MMDNVHKRSDGQQEIVAFSSKESKELEENHSSVSESLLVATNAPHVCNEVTSNSEEDPSAVSGPSLTATNAPLVCNEITSNPKEDRSADSGSSSTSNDAPLVCNEITSNPKEDCSAVSGSSSTETKAPHVCEEITSNPKEDCSAVSGSLSTETKAPHVCNEITSNSEEDRSAVSGPSSTANNAPHVCNETASNPTEDRSAVTGSSSTATNAPPVCNEITSNLEENRSQNNMALVPSNHTKHNGIPIFQGLIERVRTTVRGSSDDIGWLQRSPDMPPVEDGTDRFNNILEIIRHDVHMLPNTMVYLLVPGLFSNHGPLYFTSTKATFLKMGLTCHIAKIHSEASVEKNAREIKEYIEEFHWGSKKRVFLLGHSKGGIDAAAALSMYWPDLKDKVAGLALAQSPYGGSPIASDLMRQGQIGDYFNVRKLMEILICKMIKGDLQALEDLTYEKRKEFLKKYQLPKELPVVSLHTEANISPAVLATLSRVAHAELPSFATLSAPILPIVMPLGATLAACAQLLQTRYGEKSDGLVTCRDAEVPGSVVVRPTRKMDHAWMVYSSTNDDPLEADASQVCEALLTLLMEVALRKNHLLSVRDE